MKNKIIETLKETFSSSFMKPQCYKGIDIESELMDCDLDVEHDGFYCRCVPHDNSTVTSRVSDTFNFLRCTDWHGPFDTLDGAAQHLIDTYGYA